MSGSAIGVFSADVPGQIHHGSQGLPDADRRRFLPDHVRRFPHQRRVKGCRQTDGLGKDRGHAPLGSVQRLPVLQRRNMMGLDRHGELHIPVDPPGHLAGGGDFSLLMHKVAGIPVGAAQRIPPFLISFADVIHHLRGQLMKLFLKGEPAQQLLCPGPGIAPLRHFSPFPSSILIFG